MIKKINATNPESWLESKFVSDELKQQIQAMSKEDKEEAFADTELAFGTAGIRGKMGPGPQRINEFVYQQMAVGYCKWILSLKLDNPWIVIGHDNRLNSDLYARKCADVALAHGINVYLYENNKLMPTPIISYTIRHFKLAGGINITASHNPKEDNGFKAYNQTGSQILPDEAAVIVKNMPSSKDILSIPESLKSLKYKEGLLTYLNYDKVTNMFFDSVVRRTVVNKDFLNPKFLIKKQPIVFTGFQGTTCELMPKFLKEKLGFKRVYSVPGQDVISGNFEASPISNPENTKAFDQAIKFANKVKALVIFGVDPDGDRMTIGFKKTNRWRFLNGNEMGIIFTYYILKNLYQQYDNKPFILSSHVSTNYIDRIAKKFNADVIRTKTGFKWMCNLIDKYSEKGVFVCAFEEAIGALVHKACKDKDSFGAICLALEAYAMENCYYNDLHDFIQGEIFSQFGDTYSETISYVIDSKNWKKDADALIKKALDFKPGKIYDYTVKKVYFDDKADAVVWDLDMDSWIKFRISGTEPKFKIYLCLNNQMVGQLKTSAIQNLEIIKESVLKGFKFKA